MQYLNLHNFLASNLNLTYIKVVIKTNHITSETMKTIEQTDKAKLQTTKTWGWHVIEKNGSEDGRDLSHGFGKGKDSKKEARKFYENIK